MLKEILYSASTVISNVADKIDSIDHPIKKEVEVVGLKQKVGAALNTAHHITHKAVQDLKSKERQEKIQQFGHKVHNVVGVAFIGIGKGAGFLAKAVKTATAIPAQDIKKGFKEVYSK